MAEDTADSGSKRKNDQVLRDRVPLNHGGVIVYPLVDTEAWPVASLPPLSQGGKISSVYT